MLNTTKDAVKLKVDLHLNSDTMSDKRYPEPVTRFEITIWRPDWDMSG